MKPAIGYNIKAVALPRELATISKTEQRRTLHSRGYFPHHVNATARLRDARYREAVPAFMTALGADVRPRIGPSKIAPQFGAAPADASAKPHDRVAVNAGHPLDRADAHPLDQAADDWSRESTIMTISPTPCS